MIERIVLIKLNDENATDNGRRKVVTHAQRVLPLIPGVTSASAGVAADEASLESWDVMLKICFARIEDVPAYIVDVDHQAFVQEFLGPRAEVKKVWNFELDDELPG